MINILFVDDEPNILGGLQRMLRSMRHEWRMHFANGGIEALEMLQETPFDVVVSDMKMPGMDGAQLLQEIRNQQPQIVRIILSGYSEKEMIIKSVGSAHQYLSKPCDAEILKETIERACTLRNLLIDEKLRNLISKMHTVPSLPELYAQLMDELELPESRIQKVAEIIKKDLGMTVKILQLVNSAFFGLHHNVTDVVQAINFLGLDTIKSLALGAGVFSQFDTAILSREELQKIWEHSMEVGANAKMLAQSENPDVANVAFTAGILHDIGEVVLAVNLPEKFAEVLKITETEKVSSSEAEKRIFETTHSEIGAFLLGLWGLPHQVVEAVAFHNQPSNFQPSNFTALTAVHVADVFAHFKGHDVLSQPEKYFDVKHLEPLDLMKKLPVWKENLMEKTTEEAMSINE